jgi:hypothetical protein
MLVQIYQCVRPHIPEYLHLQKHFFCCMKSKPDSRWSKSYPRRNRDSIVSKVTYIRTWRYGVRIPAGARDLSPKCPNRLWGPPSLLFNGYRRLSPGGEAVHLRRMPRLRTSGILPPLIRCALMACTGTTLPLPLQARSLVTVVTELSRFCYLVLRRSMFFFITEPSAENR